MDPDTYCVHGAPVNWGFLGWAQHDCDKCAESLSDQHKLAILQQCLRDHSLILSPHGYGVSPDNLTVPNRCPDCKIEVTNWEEDGETGSYETVGHPVHPEMLKFVNIIVTTEHNQYGDDVIAEVLYTVGTPWEYGATYGYNTTTGVASCYAD